MEAQITEQTRDTYRGGGIPPPSAVPRTSSKYSREPARMAAATAAANTQPPATTMPPAPTPMATPTSTRFCSCRALSAFLTASSPTPPLLAETAAAARRGKRRRMRRGGGEGRIRRRRRGGWGRRRGGRRRNGWWCWAAAAAAMGGLGVGWGGGARRRRRRLRCEQRDFFFCRCFLLFTVMRPWSRLGFFRLAFLECFFFLNRINCFRYYSYSIHPLLIEITEFFFDSFAPIDHRNSKTETSVRRG
jgi:hypothetical protein